MLMSLSSTRSSVGVPALAACAEPCLRRCAPRWVSSPGGPAGGSAAGGAVAAGGAASAGGLGSSASGFGLGGLGFGRRSGSDGRPAGALGPVRLFGGRLFRRLLGGRLFAGRLLD